jgi:hypothetical protein
VTYRLKESPEPTDNPAVELSECPYDNTEITNQRFPGGFLLLECEACGAAWELHNGLVHRIREPNWERARDARIASRPGLAPTSAEGTEAG